MKLEKIVLTSIPLIAIGTYVLYKGVEKIKETYGTKNSYLDKVREGL